MLILQIETATSVCSCALSWQGQTLAVKELNEPNVHIEKLTLLITELLDQAGKTLADLEAIAVSMGPGSYTGLRIGVSTAKGLCFGLDIPLLGITTLEAMATGFVEQHSQYIGQRLVVPMIDARRREVYSAVYRSNLDEVEPVAARILDEASFQELNSAHAIILFGDGAEKFSGTYAGNQQIEVFTGFLNSASYISAPAYEKAQRGEFEDVAYFEPFYLKNFVPTTPKRK